MRSTPEQDKTLRARLQEAVDHFGDGSADQFGRLVGYANGGYIREILNNKKPVREALIGRVHAHPGMAGWFDAALSSVSAADLAAKSSRADNIIDTDALHMADLFTRLTPGQRRKLLAIVELMAHHGESVVIGVTFALPSDAERPVERPTLGLVPDR